MTLDYLGEDKRFVSATTLAATWGTIFSFELIRRKFRALFIVSGAATAYLAYEANAQYNAHKAYSRAKREHSSIRDQKIVLIAQTQKLVPISAEDQILQVNRIRKLMEKGLTPYIVTINDLNGLRSSIKNNGNEIKLLWIRSDFNENNLYLSFGEINSFFHVRVILAQELKADTPVIIEKDFSTYLFTDSSVKSKTMLTSGDEAIRAALANLSELPSVKI